MQAGPGRVRLTGPNSRQQVGLGVSRLTVRTANTHTTNQAMREDELCPLLCS